MITYIDSANAKKYSKLFSEAEEALVRKWAMDDSIDPESPEYFGKKLEDGSYEHGITSLNTYFSYMSDLLQIESLPVMGEDGTPDLDKIEKVDGLKFAILPIDEDVFEIDANSRKITVPSIFATNGISVQSDEISEIVYFKINRFYDATDLFMQNVMIEWIAPSDPKGESKNPKKGYSIPTVKILDETTNYVIFGWALSSDITEFPGDVTFAVRFYQIDDNNELLYSLSTLTQKAKIQANIGLDTAHLLKNDGDLDGYKVLGDEIRKLLQERAQNSTVGTSGDQALKPEFLEFRVDPDNDKTYVVTLAPRVGETGYIAHVTGSGYANDTGMITYFWKKFDYSTGDRVCTEGEHKLPYEQTYTPITKAQAKKYFDNASKNQYVKVYKKLANDAYSLIKDWDTDVPADDENITLYRNDSKVDIISKEVVNVKDLKGENVEKSGVGYYKLVIKNRLGGSNEQTETDPLVVYPAATPVIDSITATAFLDGEETKENQRKITVKKTIPSNPDEDPQFAKQNPVKVGFRTESGDLTDKYKFDPKKESSFVTWYHSETEAGEKSVVADETAETLVPEKEGFYTCTVTGELNGTQAISNSSEVCRVSYNPARANFTLSGLSPQNGQTVYRTNNPNYTIPEEGFNNTDVRVFVGRNNDPLVLSYNIDSMKKTSEGTAASHQLTDELTCQWYCYDLDKAKEPEDDDAVLALQGVYKVWKKTGVNTKPDYAVGESFSFTVEELEKMADTDGNVILSKFVPKWETAKAGAKSLDGYYFCVIKNSYNGRVSEVTTPFAYYDYQDED